MYARCIIFGVALCLLFGCSSSPRNNMDTIKRNDSWWNDTLRALSPGHAQQADEQAEMHAADMRKKELLNQLLEMELEQKRINYTWHKYNNENSVVWGKQSDNVLVISHGWKIIEEPADENGDLEWGWEVTLRTGEPEDNKRSYIGIENIEYTLFDKDNFKLGSSKLDLDDYGRVIWDSGKKGPVLQECGVTETYRQTSKLSKSTLKRAVSGHCRINKYP